MIRLLIRTVFLLTLTLLFSNAFAQKKVQSFTVSRIIEAPAQKVWTVVGEDYGAIANSHPGIIASEYTNGSLKGGEGVERICYLNEKKTKATHEKQVEYNPESYSFKAQVYQAEGLPMDPDYTFAAYKVKPINANSSELIMEMNYRTKPAFMGALAKGRFKRTLADYLLAVDHHVRTGEKVNKDNFKEIKKQYSK